MPDNPILVLTAAILLTDVHTTNTTSTTESTCPMEGRFSRTKSPCIPVPGIFPERRIRDVFGKIVILYHPGHVQSFDKDRLVLADDLRREFPKRVPSSIADPGVQSGHFKSGFPAIIAPPNLARHATLKFFQSLFALDEWARVFELFAVAGRGERLNADVYAGFGFGLFERLEIGFNEDADEIAAARITTDRQIDDFR